MAQHQARTADAENLGTTAQMADWIANRARGEITERARLWARHCLLDWIAVTVAGAHEPVTGILSEAAEEDGGAGTVPLVGRPGRATPYWAALINGTAGHALDYDDVIGEFIFHPTVPVLPAPLSAAAHRGLSGRELIDAFIVGVETNFLIGRMTGHAHYRNGWHATATIGTFGAAAATAYLLKLNAGRTAHALGIAAGQAAGLKAMIGTMGKPFHAGKAAQNGYLAGVLAEMGQTANPDAIEADQGFWATQAPDAKPFPVRPDPTAAFGVERTLFKYHAACYGTHSSTEAVKTLMDQHGFSAGDVEKVRIRVDSGALKICAIPEPSDGLEAKFSLRHTAAMALARVDTAAIGNYSEQLANDPKLVALRRKVEVDPQDWAHENTPRAEVVVELNDGRTVMHGHNVAVVAADVEGQWEHLTGKFRSLVAPVLGVGKTEAAIGLIEHVEDASGIVPLLEATR
jgi:2-methylcitrate dehydratase PrpD